MGFGESGVKGWGSGKKRKQAEGGQSPALEGLGDGGWRSFEDPESRPASLHLVLAELVGIDLSRATCGAARSRRSLLRLRSPRTCRARSARRRSARPPAGPGPSRRSAGVDRHPLAAPRSRWISAKKVFSRRSVITTRSIWALRPSITFAAGRGSSGAARPPSPSCIAIALASKMPTQMGRTWSVRSHP